MSSTNVHSEQSSNKYCAAAQMIPTAPEQGLDIPPKNAKPGPTRDSIKKEKLILEISAVGQYELQADGTVVDRNSGGRLGTVSSIISKENRDIRIQRAPSKYAGRENMGMEH